MRTIPVDIDGLNLILGGGIPLLKRHPEFADESATLLVRGSAGAGKTIFGTQLAGSLGRTLGCDVAYGCIELLPSELAAQHAGTKRSDVKEVVVQAPFTKHEAKGAPCRIFAGMLDMGASEDRNLPIAEAILGLLEAVEEVGGRPRILVIDSLSDGYDLGASVSRSLADDLCKMAAQRGMILILLEETVEWNPSAWSFAVDVVFQLGPSDDSPVPGVSDSFERRLVVAKNRLGPSEPGTHRFAIMQNSGITILPQPRAYLSKWAPRIILPDWKNDDQRTQEWSFDTPPAWPRFQQCITAIYGSQASDVSRTAWNLGLPRAGSKSPVTESDIFLDFGRSDSFVEPSPTLMTRGTIWPISCGDPYLSGDWILSTVVAVLDEIRNKDKAVRRVLVGDLQSLRSFWDPDGIRRSLGVLVAIMRRAIVPVVIFETSATQAVTIETFGPAQVPLAVDFADVVIEVRSTSQSQPGLTVSHARSGERLLR